MKKLRSLICMLIMVAVAMSMIPSVAFAASDTAINAANELYKKGLFQGTGKNADGTPNFDLDRAPTRNEAVTMLVRLLGKEDEAKAGSWNIPFTDVADWAKPYVGYAYANGLTTGTGSTTYSGDQTVTAAQYITFVLRSLGYKDGGVDFSWYNSWRLSDKIGLTNHEYNENTTDFTRGDVALISYKSLSIEHYVAVDRIELNESSLSMEIGESVTLTATVSPADATGHDNITWTSSDPDVADVSNGKVTALSPGSTTIEAVITDQWHWDSASCTVTVTAKPISFSGTGDTVISNINIPAGTYYAEYTHSGRRNFISKFYYGSESYEYFRISNEIGDCSGQVALKDNDNAAVTNGILEVKADGAWTINFIPVSGTTTTNIKGHGDVVTGLFTANSPRYVVSMTHNGERNFIAKVIEYNGKSYDYESLVNEIGTYSGEKVINLDVGKQYFLYVQADGNWTFDFGLGDAVTTYAPPAIPSSTGSDSGSNNDPASQGQNDDKKWSIQDAHDLSNYISSGSKFVNIANDYALEAFEHGNESLRIANLKLGLSAAQTAQLDYKAALELLKSRVELTYTTGGSVTEDVQSIYDTLDQLSKISADGNIEDTSAEFAHGLMEILPKQVRVLKAVSQLLEAFL